MPDQNLNARFDPQLALIAEGMSLQEIKVESCLWVHEMDLVDGKWKTMRRRHGVLAKLPQ